MSDSSRSFSNIRYARDGGRQGRLLAVNTFSGLEVDENGLRQVDPFFLGMSVSLYLGWRDVHEKRGDVLPHLPQLLEHCDLQTSLEIRDAQASPKAAIDELLEAAMTEQDQPPFALLGGLFSFISQQLTILASGFDLPQISGASTSSELDGVDLFARTIPTNAADARAAMTYFHHLGVTQVASIFVNEAYGIQYNQALQLEANRLGIKLVFFALDATLTGLEKEMQDLKKARVKYVFCGVLQQHFRELFAVAVQQGVLGNPDYLWLMGDMASLMGLDFELDPETERDLAQGIHGLGSVVMELDSPSQPLFDASYLGFRDDPSLQADFLSKTAVSPHNFTTLVNASLTNIADPYLYNYMVYDAVIAMGLAACNTPGLFTGQELYQELLQTEFEGVTGPVSFHPTTGGRTAVSTRYTVYNFLLSQNKSTESLLKLDVIRSAVVMGDNVTITAPYVYHDNTTIPPPDLPPIEHYNYNLIPIAAQACGMGMGVAVMLASMGLLAWTVANRRAFIVSAAQPHFLAQLCVGCGVLASTAIPLGLQGTQSTPSLNSACMAIPWLLYTGSMLSISAILSKAWRLRQVVGAAEGMRRVSVTSWDVLPPFALMLTVNLACLIAWTIVSPMEYTRIEVENLDEFGRNTESYGRCRSSNGDHWVAIFAGVAGATNACGFFFAAYQCYKLWNVTSYFSEASSLAHSMGSLLETVLLGGPILLVVKDSNPTIYFLVASAMICISCLSLLIPIFYFKIRNKDSSYGDARQDGERQKRRQKRLLEIALSELDDLNDSQHSGVSRVSRASSGVLRIHRSSVTSARNSKTMGGSSSSRSFFGLSGRRMGGNKATSGTGTSSSANNFTSAGSSTHAL